MILKPILIFCKKYNILYFTWVSKYSTYNISVSLMYKY